MRKCHILYVQHYWYYGSVEVPIIVFYVSLQAHRKEPAGLAGQILKYQNIYGITTCILQDGKVKSATPFSFNSTYIY